MVSQDVVWFESDVEFENAIRAMRPAGRRPGVWAAILVLIGVPLVVIGLKAKPWVARIPVVATAGAGTVPAATLQETPLVPIHVAKTERVRHKSPKSARREQRVTAAGRLPRRTWPAWASSGTATRAPAATTPTSVVQPTPAAVVQAPAPATAAQPAPVYEAVAPTQAPVERALEKPTPMNREPPASARAEAPTVVADDDASVESADVEMPADPTPKAKRGDAWKAVLE